MNERCRNSPHRRLRHPMPYAILTRTFYVFWSSSRKHRRHTDKVNGFSGESLSRQFPHCRFWRQFAPHRPCLWRYDTKHGLYRHGESCTHECCSHHLTTRLQHIGNAICRQFLFINAFALYIFGKGIPYVVLNYV